MAMLPLKKATFGLFALAIPLSRGLNCVIVCLTMPAFEFV